MDALRVPVITRLWLDRWNVRLVDATTGRSTQLCIPFCDTMMEPQELEDVLLEQEETFATECLKWQPKKGLPKSQEKGLGDTLKEITESKNRRKQIGHGKYW